MVVSDKLPLYVVSIDQSQTAMLKGKHSEVKEVTQNFILLIETGWSADQHNIILEALPTLTHKSPYVI
jgi:hypothetical protein